MAQRTVVVLTDDLTGDELADGQGETVAFALDGKSYEIDLSEKNADGLRKALKNYISAGRPTGGRSRGTKRTNISNAREIRDWARSNGHEVPDRGRIPASVMDAWNAR
jgi:hypothetical protein